MTRQFSDGTTTSPPESTLAGALSIGAVSLTVGSGHGTRFPASGSFSLRLEDATDPTDFEIVSCTSRSTDVLTITATVKDWDAADKVVHVIAKVDLDAFLQRDAVSALRPTGSLYENFTRNSASLISSGSALTTATLLLTAIWLPAGVTITSISFQSGGTAATTPLNQWFALYDSSRALLRQTTDDTTTAWAANAVKTLPLTSTFVTTYEGLYYIGALVVATTVPALVAIANRSNTLALAPILNGTSTAALTTTAPNPAAAITATAPQPWCYVS